MHYAICLSLSRSIGAKAMTRDKNGAMKVRHCYIYNEGTHKVVLQHGIVRNTIYDCMPCGSIYGLEPRNFLH